MIATNTAIKARRTAQQARQYLKDHPGGPLARYRAEALIAAAEEAATQIDELNRLLFHAECELHYADEAACALADERDAPPWLTALQDDEAPLPRPPLLGVPIAPAVSPHPSRPAAAAIARSGDGAGGTARDDEGGLDEL